MRKKILNLALVLSLSLVAGFSFSTMEEASANPTTVDCTDVPEIVEGQNQRRVCKPNNVCPWMWIYIPQSATIGKCVL